MNKEQVLKTLKEHKKEIQKFHIERIYLFGSVARNEDTSKSDIDILIKFDIPPTYDLYIELKFYLEDLLGRKVDLVTEDAVRVEIRPFIDQDLIRVA